MNPETLIGRTPNLQPPSPTVLRLLDLLNKPDADYDEAIAIVNRDAVLSARLLAICNSAAYGLAQSVASIEQGVLYLGMSEIHRLVLSLSFGSQISPELPGYDMEAGALWHHSLVTALLTPHVLRLSKSFAADASIAYTAGLVHDIGKLVIGQALNAATRDRLHQMVQAGESILLDAEKSVIGCDHAEVGACLLRQWRIPEIIAEAVAHHHHPNLDGSGSLSAHVHAADAVAHQIGASPGWESFAFSLDESAITFLGLSGADIEALTFAALDCREKVLEQEKVIPRKNTAARMGNTG
jgi:putative nucleotidyltransferase with HDIG domain